MTIHNFLGDGPNGMNSGSHVALKQGCRVQLKPKIDVVHLGDQGDEEGEAGEGDVVADVVRSRDQGEEGEAGEYGDEVRWALVGVVVLAREGLIEGEPGQRHLCGVH